MLLVYGKGYIASAVLEAWGDAARGSTVDICDTEAVRRELAVVRPTAVLNAAAFLWTSRPADCEVQRVKTFAVNTMAPYDLARVTQELGVRMFHVSTAFFYSGDNGGAGFAETDVPNAVFGAYTESKYEAEKLLAPFDHVAVLRINKPFDTRFSGVSASRNYLAKLVAYPKVFDVWSNMTPVPFFVDVLRQCEQQEWTGVYHVTSVDAPSTVEIRSLYQEIVDPSADFVVSPMTEQDALFSPSFLLSTESLARKGITAPNALNAIQKVFLQSV